jgi:hypothetical protein
MVESSSTPIIALEGYGLHPNDVGKQVSWDKAPCSSLEEAARKAKEYVTDSDHCLMYNSKGKYLRYQTISPCAMVKIAEWTTFLYGKSFR